MLNQSRTGNSRVSTHTNKSMRDDSGGAVRTCLYAGQAKVCPQHKLLAARELLDHPSDGVLLRRVLDCALGRLSLDASSVVDVRE